MTEAEIRKEAARQLDVIREGAVDFYGEEELAERLATCLKEERPLRVKLGLDPSSSDLHLGHSVVLMKLRRFLELGHTAIFLVGDFTARIGDPSGRNKARPPLDADQVRRNAETYVEQVAKLMDVSKVEVRYNGEWMDAMKPSDFVRLCSHSTVARMLERDDFSKRYAGEVPIFIHEFLYPLVQGYDSVALESDVELGGTDQTFNLLMGRELQRVFGQPPQAVLTHGLLVGLDGHEKMSKSLGNSIGITDEPGDMYGKAMSIPDDLMEDWHRLLAMGDWAELGAGLERLRAGEGNPMTLKHDLAHAIVARVHDAEAADAARDAFERVVQRKEVPDDVAEVAVSLGGQSELRLTEVLVVAKLAPSKSEARRLVQQGGVKVDQARQDDPNATLAGGGSYLVQVGKRRFAQVVLA